MTQQKRTQYVAYLNLRKNTPPEDKTSGGHPYRHNFILYMVENNHTPFPELTVETISCCYLLRTT